MPAKLTFEEVDDGFEIGLEAGVIMFCKAGEGADIPEFPAGTAMLTQMLGDEVAVFEPPIPLDTLWQNLGSARYSPEYVHWLHPADYDAAVRRFAASTNA
jgi:hypothetical protein